MNNFISNPKQCNAGIWETMIRRELALQRSLCRMAQEEIQACLASLQDDGRWPDIDYTDRSRAGFAPSAHLNRMVGILSGSCADDAVRCAMLRALDQWLIHDYQSDNWWYNEIHTPNALGVIGLFLRADLNQNGRESKCCEILSRGTRFPEGDEGWTGANLMWGINTTLKHALITRDETLLAHASRLLDGVIVQGMEEGIQEDNSYFQHGHQLQTGHYGWSFVEEASRLLYTLAGGPYPVSKRAMGVLCRYTAEGVGSMVWRGAWNVFALGRSFFRKGAVRAESGESAVRRLLDAKDGGCREGLSSLAAAMAGAEPAPGGRYFPVGGYYSRFGDGFYIASRVADSTILPGEICNGEGILGLNLAGGGVTCVMTDATEYLDIAPVWDYAKIPGVTALLESDDEIRAKTGWASAPARNAYRGGGHVDTDDGGVGVLYMDLCHNTVTGVISRFFFDGGMVALGADIAAEGRAVTALEQCRARADCEVEPDLVRHGGICYVSLDASPLLPLTERRRGSWQRVASESGPELVEADVFSLCVDHGESPRGASYAYAVLPAKCAEDARKTKERIAVLRNDGSCQAVRLNGWILCVFHRPCRLTLPGGRVVDGEGRSHVILPA